ncbi:MAG: hypothetical protein PWP04_1158 [Candidatus Atribacteria bacterium]|nr:hypothetical protein [Candidatus Atribacteria bacterium]
MKIPRFLLFIPFALGLVVLGFGLSGVGSVIPEISERFSIPYSVVGRIFLFHGAGYFLSLLFAGFLGDMVSQAFILRLGLFLLVVGFSGIAFLPTFSLIVIFFMTMGVGLGFLDCMINPVATTIFVRQPGTILNLLHAFFGLGSLLAPRLYSGINQLGGSWQNFYQVILAITLVTFLLFLFPFIPKKSSTLPFKELLGVFRKKVFWYMGLTMMFYAGGVSTLNGWLVSYLNQGGMTLPQAAVFLSHFWTGLFAGRVVLSFLADRIGYLNLIRLNSIGGFIFVALAVWTPIHPVQTAIFLFISGFMLSTLVPTTLAYAIGSYPETASTAAGWVLFNNGMGNLLFPWLGGIIATTWGLKASLSLVPLFLVVMFVFQQLLTRNSLRRRTEQ